MTEPNVSGVGYFLKVITDKIKVKADADLKSRNLTLTQSRVLAFLCSKGGQVTQKDIEEFMGVAHPTVVGIVARMELNGFLTCRVDASDKRNKIVALTPHAQDIGNELAHFIAQQEEKMLVGLTQEQIDSLRQSLSVIYDNLCK